MRIFSHWVNLTISVLCFAFGNGVPAQDETATKQKYLDAETFKEQERIRRQEATIDAQMLIKQAENQLALRNYEKALGLYQEADKKLARAPVNAEYLAQIQDGASKCYYYLALEALDKKNYKLAADQAEKALQLNPKDPTLLELREEALAGVKRGETRQQRGAKEAAAAPEISDPDFKKKQESVLKLYRSYENYFKSEQYDEAENTLKAILTLDPYSATAYHRLREVQLAKFRKLTPARNQAESDFMLEVQKGWVLPNRVGKIPPVNNVDINELTLSSNTEKIVKKLNSILIKKIEFENTPLKNAVDFLINQSRELDPSGEGVNILLSSGLGVSTTGGPSAAPAASAAPTGSEATPGGFGGGAPGAAPNPPISEPTVAPASGGVNVNLNLRNVPLLMAIKFLTEQASLKYKIEPDAVVIVSNSEGAIRDKTQTRIFNVNPGVFRGEIERVAGTPAAGGPGGFVSFSSTDKLKTNRADVRKVFQDFGIEFPGGTNVSYNEGLGLLVVTHTTDVLDQIEQIIFRLNKTPDQVQIETKFMDIRQTDLEELSFEWAFAGQHQQDFVIESGRGTALPGLPTTRPFPAPGTRPGAQYLGLGNPITGGVRTGASITASALDGLLGGGGSPLAATVMTITGFLTDPQMQIFINALSQKGIVNLLQAPRVTTLSGESAKILITREFIYPSAFTEPQVVAGSAAVGGGASSVGIVAPSPSAFATREIGVILDVKPTVGPDHYTINLTLSPEVVDFEGFINYSTFAVANGVQFTFPIQQPVFNKRTLSTSVTVWDGQTVVLGGLINESNTKVNDKVPFLGDIPFIGRFFQSKVDQTTKRNLTIFLSARIVDPAGNPIKRAEGRPPVP